MNKIFITALLLASYPVFAQDDKIRFTVNPGEKVVEKIPREEIYRYPRFEVADISFMDGKRLTTWLNYNSLFGEMQFINPPADTLSIADEKNIKQISFEKDTFFFADGWLQQLTSNGVVKLARKKRIEISNKEKIGAMDVPGFGAIETNNKLSGSQVMKDIIAKEKLTYTVYYTYFFGDRFNKFFPATKNTLLKLYGKKGNEVEKYVENNKINFLDEGDLRKLFEYLYSM